LFSFTNGTSVDDSVITKGGTVVGDLTLGLTTTPLMQPGVFGGKQGWEIAKEPPSSCTHLETVHY